MNKDCCPECGHLLSKNRSLCPVCGWDEISDQNDHYFGAEKFVEYNYNYADEYRPDQLPGY